MKEAGASSTVSLDSLGSSEGSVDDKIDYECGELRLLSMRSFGEVAEDTPESEQKDKPGSVAFYGERLSEEDAIRLVEEGEGGLILHAIVIPDKFIISENLISGLNKRDFNLQTQEIKPRRGSLPITQTQLFSSITRVSGGENGRPRYIFNGVLNGWPGLRNFELIRLEKKRSLGPLTTPEYFNTFSQAWSNYWSADDSDASPLIDDQDKIYRATLRGAPWSGRGWSKQSPGFVFWFEAQNDNQPRLTYGKNMETVLEECICTNVHMVSHRYYVERESPKDKLTYHSLCVLEWDHGRYCSVVEGAFLNGVGGYKGMCNWYTDKDAPEGTALFKALPPEMIKPWLSSASELRCYDVEAKNFNEFKEYMVRYQGKRFLDVQFTFSHPVRLSFRSKRNIAHFLLNYIDRDMSYSELTRNCQTFAADLCSFLAGKKGIIPYHPINRVEYHNRSHLFLYDATMYSRKF